ncbi:ATP-binding protein [Streptomyces sp. NPDC048483]|uniref:ATP-binding protein n=1 Tax=Streptomyces sp. NPDC048483 TaxID=3154927 RepID=UPI00341D2352
MDLHTEGTRSAVLPPSFELTVYRIVQEALTNARRHAQGAKVSVRLEFGPSRVRLRVVDDGPGPGPRPAEPGSGRHGLSGMGERASLLDRVDRARPVHIRMAGAPATSMHHYALPMYAESDRAWSLG